MKIILLIFLIPFSLCYSQANDLYITKNFQLAYQNQTRALDGTPGNAYWQNRADYSVQVSLDPSTRVISGTEIIHYKNNSPDILEFIIIHLFPNVYKKGTARDFKVAYDDETDGVLIQSIRINEKEIDVSENSPAISYLHNDIKVHLPSPLSPGDECTVAIAWQYIVNRHSHMRTGQVDPSSFFIAYFFPRIAVYDDIDGWNDFFYSGRAEFYNDFGDFDVSITVPRNYIIWATGILQNPEEVLTKKYADRLHKAMNSDQVLSIIDVSDDPNKITQNKHQNTWKFQAQNVNDFAFATSDHYLWDGSGLVVDKDSEKSVFISAAYNRDSQDFYQVAQIAREAINFMSTDFPGVPFPYPELTVFNGLDEMEYPMMVNDLSFDDMSYVRKVTSHEIFHTYFPFYMGINESKYAWMDEGFASYGDYLISKALDKTGYYSIYYLDRYKQNQILDTDLPIMSNSKFLKKYAYHYNAYAKPAVFLIILRDLLGDDLFKSVIKIFMKRWQGKHPTPYDFFYTLNDETGQNLTWLFQPWFFEFGFADIGLKKVQKTEKEYQVIIEKFGNFPVPVAIQLTYTDGSTKIVKKPVSIWKDGKTEAEINVATNESVLKVELIPGILPDADASNNLIVVN